MATELPDWVQELPEADRPTLDSTFSDLHPHVQQVLHVQNHTRQHGWFDLSRKKEGQIIDGLASKDLGMRIDDTEPESHWAELGLVLSTNTTYQTAMPWSADGKFHREILGEEAIALLDHLSEEQRVAIANTLAPKFCEDWRKVPERLSARNPRGAKALEMIREFNGQLRKVYDEIVGVEESDS